VQTSINGSGLSINYGWLLSENSFGQCINSAHNAPGNTNAGQNVRDYRQAAGPAAQCGGSNNFLNDNTIARYTDPRTGQGTENLACGDRLMIFGGTGDSGQGAYPQAIKTVTDRCGLTGCGTGHHLDNFSTNGSCSPLYINYSNTTVIRLH
jgi:hypothetical protein